MRNIQDLLDQMAEEEEAFAQTSFLAPCIAGGRVRARVGGIVQTFTVEPPAFQGWGIFQANGKTAVLQEEADLPLVAGYLKHFPILRVLLCCPFEGQTWLAYPANEADMAQRFGEARPVVVQLVTEGATLEPVLARNVGGIYWFEEVDRRADPTHTEQMREALRQGTEPAQLRFSGLTPEMRSAYGITAQTDTEYAEARRRRIVQEVREQERQAREQERQNREEVRRAERQYRREYGYNAWEQAHADAYDDYHAGPVTPPEPPAPVPPAPARPRRGNRAARRNPPPQNDNEQRLREALQTGGGQMRRFTDRGDYYLVEWTSANGSQHTSAIARRDLTVISSGICLSGRDRDFDLQSLVGVIDRRGY